MLANELIVSRLAALLGAPTPPDATTVEIREPVLADARAELAALGPATSGVGFGCRWLEVEYDPSAETCRTAVNRPRLVRLAGLYLWVRNSDLKGEHLLKRTLPDGAHEVLGFDHGHCFGSPTWDSSIASLAGTAFALAASSIDQGVEVADVQDCCKALLDLTDDQIAGTVVNVPAEWGLTDELGDALRSYLINSRPAVKAQLCAMYAAAQGAAP